MKKLITIIILVTLLMMTVSSAVVVSAQEPEPTEEPTVEPTEEPTVEPTEEPTVEPTEEPTVEPTEEPTEEPTVEPTEEPTVEPTEEPTVEPTEEPTVEPTEEPTVEPTEEPTVEPTEEPTVEPTEEPTVETTVGATGEIGATGYDSSQSTKVYAMNVGSAITNIAIQYYDTAGNPVVSDPPCNSVAVNGQCIFDGSALASSFRGSGVISSGEPAVAVVRIIGGTYSTLADYTGKAQNQGDASVYLPSVHRSVWRALISAQNMGSAPTQIDITVRDPGGGVAATDSKSNVQPGATAYFDLWNDAAFSGLGSSWYGSATLNGNGQPVHAVVMESNTEHGGKYTYEGFTTSDGGTTIYYAVIHRNYSGTTPDGWNSGSYIQNLDTNNPVTVQVTWRDDVASGGAIARQVSYDIPANSSKYLTTYFEPSTRNTWAGSMVAQITSGTGPIVGISSDVYALGSNISAFAEYRAVKEGTTTLYSPIAEGHYNGLVNTGDYARHFVQNLGGGTARVVGEWTNPTTGITLHSETVDIASGASFYFAPNRQPQISGMWSFSGTFKATTTTPGASLIGLTFDSTPFGNVSGESNYPSDATGLFNLPGQ